MADTITLEYRGKKGDTQKYKTLVHSVQTLKEKGNTSEAKNTIEIIMTQTIQDTDKDGNIVVDVIIEQGKVKKDGEETTLPNVGQKITMKMKKTGEVLETTSPVDFSQPAFPEGPKKIKDRWDSISEIKVQDRPEPIKLNYKYILWDILKHKNYDCAEIKVSCPETTVELQPGVNQTISATGSTHFAHKNGFLIDSEIETQTLIEIPTEDMSINTRIRVTVEIIK